MMISSTLEQAQPGRENAKDWLLLKIVECSSEPMSDKIAERLSTYNAAYNALCQWDDEREKEKNKDFSEKNAANESSELSISLDMAKVWTQTMQNEDGSKGPHWTLDQVKQLMAQKKIQKSPAEFWAALNMIYSDYVKVAKKHGVGGNIDFYIDMALAFLNDKDANPNKLACYYKNVVKH